MNKIIGETLDGRSSRFWALAAGGFVLALGGVLVCGLLVGAGVYAVTRLTVPETTTNTDTAAAETADTAKAEAEEVGAIQQEPGLPPRLGNPAANFTLSDLAGNTVSLADFKGQPVILNFWATWCGPCEAEMPEIDKAYLKHKEEGLVVLAINLAEHPDTVKSFVNYYELAFTILLDRDKVVGKLYGARALPTTYFIDRSGTIVHTYYGQMDEEALAIGLQKILP
jgi:peroxiredoxin